MANKTFSVVVPFAGHVLTSIVLPEEATDDEIMLALFADDGPLADAVFDVASEAVERLQVSWYSDLCEAFDYGMLTDDEKLVAWTQPDQRCPIFTIVSADDAPD